MICAAPAWLTPAFGHLGKARPAPAKRKNCWLWSSPAAVLVLGDTAVSQALAVAPGRCAAPNSEQHQPIRSGHPRAEQSKHRGWPKPGQRGSPLRGPAHGNGPRYPRVGTEQTSPLFRVFLSYAAGFQGGTTRPFNWLFLLLLSENNNNGRFMFLLFFLISVF